MPDQPKQLGIAPKEPVIYTIPEQFYGLAAKAQLPKEVAAPAAPGVPAAPAAPAAPAPSQKGSKAWILIPIIAVLLLVGIGFGIWMLMKPKKSPAPTQPSVTLPTTPTPQPAPEPVPEPEPEPVPEPATTTTEVSPAPRPEADEDGDGLTTAEETLFGTDAKKSDSDDDGFSDSVEVTNLYNPAGFKPTKLIEAGLVNQYVNAEPVGGTPFRFALLHPSAWSTTPTAQFVGVDVASQDGQRFMVTETPEAVGKTPLDWYLSANPAVAPSQVQVIKTKSGLEGVLGPDGMTAYVLADGVLYEIKYLLAEGTAAAYRSTFTMFVNSFSEKP